MFQRGAGSRWAAAPVLVYTPDISTAWSPLGCSAITLPRVPSSPSDSVNSDSWKRSSSGSTPSITSVQAGSGSTIGSSPCRRRAIWSATTAANISGPAPSLTTPAGRPLGSTPRRSAPGWREMPLRHSSRMIHRPESDLSVMPISTCLASLVTRGSARPASVAAPRAISTASASPSMPAVASRTFTAVSRSDTIRAASPRTANRSTVSCAARDRAASSSVLAVRR